MTMQIDVFGEQRAHAQCYQRINLNNLCIFVQKKKKKEGKIMDNLYSFSVQKKNNNNSFFHFFSKKKTQGRRQDDT